MTYQEERDRVVYWLAKAGLVFGDIRTLLRLSQSVQTLAVLKCNVPLTDKQQHRERRLHAGIQAIASKYPSAIKECNIHGDPRGHVVTLLVYIPVHDEVYPAYNPSNRMDGLLGIPTK